MTLRPRDFLAGRILMLAFLLILVSRDVANLLADSPAAAQLTLSLVLVAAICLVYGWFWLRVAGADSTLRAGVAVVVLTALVVVYTLSDPSLSYPFYYSFYYCALVAGAAFSWRWGILAVAAVTTVAATAVIAEGSRGTVISDLVLVMLLLGVGAVAVRRHVANFVQLRLAREEIRRLAIAEERLRLSRDLHDQLGQSLTTVVLQSEALRLELGETRDAASQRAGTVADTARSALDAMRDVAAGYRHPELAAELMEAHRMLEACGVRSHLTVAEDAGAGADPTTAWAVREAVTNVLRHSGARNCWIDLRRSPDGIELSVTDDGRGAGDTIGGSGLAGLRERVEAVGGRVTTDSKPGKGFRLQVRLLSVE
ncbi:MAG: two-component system, NarL family, sensor histidine kinase DesK [Chloroflexota bacterium]|jgi:two-component system sensor histidine kinase DesK|nr:two-component system, NarL family, sensor histidine kinase DesK [Chloroflexota bacterium]